MGRAMSLGKAACLLLLLALVAPASAVAQTSMGVVNGTVTDTTGGLVPGATVTLVSEATNVQSVRQTNQNGYFVFVNVRPGTYTLTVELRGDEDGPGVPLRRRRQRDADAERPPRGRGGERGRGGDGPVRAAAGLLGRAGERDRGEGHRGDAAAGPELHPAAGADARGEPGLHGPGRGAERERELRHGLRGRLRDPRRLHQQRLDPGAAEPLQGLLRGRDHQHQRARGLLRRAAGHRLPAGVQGPVARRQGGVRRRHGRGHQHDVEVGQQPLPRHRLRVLPQRGPDRPQPVPGRLGRAGHEAPGVQAEPVRGEHRGAHHQGQDVLLRLVRRLALQRLYADPRTSSP